MSAERSVSNRIFVDTLFVIALINRRDQYHQQALDLAEQFEGSPLLVTDAVLLEIGNALARSYKQEAVEIIEQFLAAEEVEVVHLTPRLFAQGSGFSELKFQRAWGWNSAQYPMKAVHYKGLMRTYGRGVVTLRLPV
jgi:predicted nucleic acid-binding protein